MSDILVLCYHAVSERWPAALSVRPDQLEQHLALLLGSGYRGTTFEAATTHEGEESIFAVTFDDAFASVHRRALPILERLGIPGTVFAPTAFVGRDEPMSWPGIDHWPGEGFAEEVRPMGWGDLGHLADLGWEIGSHTRTHPRLTDIDDQALDRELRESRLECEERLGRSCRTLAYPFGAADERVAAAARSAGYRAAATLSSRLSAPERMLWPRVGVYGRDGSRRFRLKASSRVRRLRMSPAWGLVELARRASNPSRPGDPAPHGS